MRKKNFMSVTTQTGILALIAKKLDAIIPEINLSNNAPDYNRRYLVKQIVTSLRDTMYAFLKKKPALRTSGYFYTYYCISDIRKMLKGIKLSESAEQELIKKYDPCKITNLFNDCYNSLEIVEAYIQNNKTEYSSLLHTIYGPTSESNTKPAHIPSSLISTPLPTPTNNIELDELY